MDNVSFKKGDLVFHTKGKMFFFIVSDEIIYTKADITPYRLLSARRPGEDKIFALNTYFFRKVVNFYVFS